MPDETNERSGVILPAHLRDDAPFLVCSRCGRKSWGGDSAGKPCGMSQPDGSLCRGTFTEANTSKPATESQERPPFFAPAHVSDSVSREPATVAQSCGTIDIDELRLRIVRSIERVKNGTGNMRVPAEQSDPDVTLSICLVAIEHFSANNASLREQLSSQAEELAELERHHAKCAEHFRRLMACDERIAELERVNEELRRQVEEDFVKVQQFSEENERLESTVRWGVSTVTQLRAEIQALKGNV